MEKFIFIKSLLIAVGMCLSTGLTAQEVGNENVVNDPVLYAPSELAFPKADLSEALMKEFMISGKNLTGDIKMDITGSYFLTASSLSQRPDGMVIKKEEAEAGISIEVWFIPEQGPKEWKGTITFSGGGLKENKVVELTGYCSGEAIRVGEKNNPYTIKQIKEKGVATLAWVKGYIVGGVKEGKNQIVSPDEAVFNFKGINPLTLLLADNPRETDYTKCFAIDFGEVNEWTQPTIAALNLSDNPENLGKMLVMHGTTSGACGIDGMKSAGDFVIEGGYWKPELVESVFLSEDFKDDSGSFHSMQFGSLPEGLRYVWSHNKEGYIEANACRNGVNYKARGWWVSPELDFTDVVSAKLTFEHAANSFRNPKDELTVRIGTHHPVSSRMPEWVQVDIPNYPDENENGFVSSGEIDLSAVVRKPYVFIYFQYESTEEIVPDWKIRNVKIVGKKLIRETGQTILFETFATDSGEFTDINIILPEGEKTIWKNDSVTGCMKAGEFTDDRRVLSQGWLVSPSLDLSGQNAFLTFEQAVDCEENADPANYLKVMVSKDSPRGDELTVGHWDELPIPGLPRSGGLQPWASSGEIMLPQGDNVRFAFFYSSSQSVSPVWQIKNISVTGNASYGLATSITSQPVSAIRLYVTGDALRVEVPEAGTVEVYNMTGQKIKTQQVAEGTNEITDLRKGNIYILKYAGRAYKVVI